MPTNFLEAAGTSGFITAVLNLLSTEAGFGSLVNGGAVTSSVGGTAGVFSQSNIGNGIWGSLWFTSGGAMTPVAGGFLAGWFLRSVDGGTTFEAAVATPSATVSALPRSPDFIIPLSNAAYAANNVTWCSSVFVKLPWESFKVVLQNLSGVTLPASGNKITVGPVAVQY
jgi:hypothetical protein